jgi:hypothetical protein
MKRLLLATCVVALAVGCAPAPDTAPISSNTTNDLEISIPDQGTEGETEANTTLVTLNVPGMT